MIGVTVEEEANPVPADKLVSPHFWPANARCSLGHELRSPANQHRPSRLVGTPSTRHCRSIQIRSVYNSQALGAPFSPLTSCFARFLSFPGDLCISLITWTVAMSRSRFPPTPAMSGEFTIKDQPADATDVFALPPAALASKADDPYSRRSSQSDPTYVPASPTSPDLMARNRTTQQSRSGNATKRSLEDFDLPPPPTRTRKIIQMKPKPQPTTKSPSKPKENGKAQASPESNPKDSAPKKKQPSATSAAGRKIARKTAHSLIERRRRSKMNEEFGTLKDMIPACTGQEMHKLAILQVCSHNHVTF